MVDKKVTVGGVILVATASGAGALTSEIIRGKAPVAVDGSTGEQLERNYRLIEEYNDGDTTDWAPEVQAFLDDPEKPRKLVLGRGTYHLKTGLTTCRPHILEGQGQVTIVTAPGSVTPLTYTYPASAGNGRCPDGEASRYSTVRDLVLKASTETLGTRQAGILVEGRIHLEHLTIDGWSHGVLLHSNKDNSPPTNANGWSMFDVTAQSANHAGFYFTGPDANAGSSWLARALGNCTNHNSEYATAATQVWRVSDPTGTPVYVDETVDFNSAATGDTAVFPESEVAGDRLLIGYDYPFDDITLTLSTPGVGGTVSVRYWDGNSYEPVPDLTDGTADLTASGDISFTMPSVWPQNTESGALKHYLAVQVETAYSTNPVLSQGTLNFDPYAYIVSCAGIVDDSFLGNVWLAPQTATNGATNEVPHMRSPNPNSRNLVVGMYAENNQKQGVGSGTTVTIGGHANWEGNLSINAGVIANASLVAPSITPNGNDLLMRFDPLGLDGRLVKSGADAIVANDSGASNKVGWAWNVEESRFTPRTGNLIRHIAPVTEFMDFGGVDIPAVSTATDTCTQFTALASTDQVLMTPQFDLPSGVSCEQPRVTASDGGSGADTITVRCTNATGGPAAVSGNFRLSILRN